MSHVLNLLGLRAGTRARLPTIRLAHYLRDGLVKHLNGVLRLLRLDRRLAVGVLDLLLILLGLFLHLLNVLKLRQILLDLILVCLLGVERRNAVGRRLYFGLLVSD